MLFIGMPKFFSPHNILVSQFLCSQLRLSGQTVDYWEVTLHFEDSLQRLQLPISFSFKDTSQSGKLYEFGTHFVLLVLLTMNCVPMSCGFSAC